MNKVILMGNLTRDPELKHLPNGNSSVVNFGLAMNERWNDSQSGEQKETVCFVEVEAWNRQAEVINEYFKKGSQILVEGSLKFDQWQAEDGSNRNRLKVRLQRFEFVGPNPNGNGNSNSEQMANDEPPARTTDDVSDDDVPF